MERVCYIYLYYNIFLNLLFAQNGNVSLMYLYFLDNL